MGPQFTVSWKRYTCSSAHPKTRGQKNPDPARRSAYIKKTNLLSPLQIAQGSLHTANLEHHAQPFTPYFPRIRFISMSSTASNTEVTSSRSMSTLDLDDTSNGYTSCTGSSSALWGVTRGSTTISVNAMSRTRTAAYGHLIRDPGMVVFDRPSSSKSPAMRGFLSDNRIPAKYYNLETMENKAFVKIWLNSKYYPTSDVYVFDNDNFLGNCDGMF